MHTIAIDCGASFIKAALFDDHGGITSQVQKISPVVHGSEDVLQTVQITALVPIVRQILSDFVRNVSKAKLCISNEMHGFILAYADGTPFTDYISWQKEYGAIKIDGKSSVDMLLEGQFSDDIIHTGMQLRGGLPSSNVLYLSRSGILKKAKSKLFFYTLGDYLIKALFGIEPMCHPTNAAATGLYDVVETGWNERLKNACCAKEILFPKIGTKAVEIVFENCELQVFPAIGDQQAALLGAGLASETDLSFNLGTGAQVSKPVKNIDFSNRWQIRPYFNGFYLKTIPHLPSGRALNVYIRFFKELLQGFCDNVSNENIWGFLLAKESECSETSLHCDLSFFQNAVTDYTVGSISNIDEYGLSVGCLMKSLFSQMIDNFLSAAMVIEPLPKAVKRIIFSGGVAKRIESIRGGIMQTYYGADVLPLIENETLYGLYKISGVL